MSSYKSPQPPTLRSGQASLKRGAITPPLFFYRDVPVRKRGLGGFGFLVVGSKIKEEMSVDGKSLLRTFITTFYCVLGASAVMGCYHSIHPQCCYAQAPAFLFHSTFHDVGAAVVE